MHYIMFWANERCDYPDSLLSLQTDATKIKKVNLTLEVGAGLLDTSIVLQAPLKVDVRMLSFAVPQAPSHVEKPNPYFQRCSRYAI